jgi:Transposase DDE domain
MRSTERGHCPVAVLATCNQRADAKGRLIANLLTGGEAHDCPVAERLIDRVEPAELMLGDKAYDSNELRDELDQRESFPTVPTENVHSPSASASTSCAGASRVRLSALPQPLSGGFNESGP